MRIAFILNSSGLFGANRSLLGLIKYLSERGDVCFVMISRVGSIEQEFPSVRLFRGSGGFYWCKSMHYAMREAVKENFDLYLMVNDDVDFADNALALCWMLIMILIRHAV